MCECCIEYYVKKILIENQLVLDQRISIEVLHWIGNYMYSNTIEVQHGDHKQ